MDPKTRNAKVTNMVPKKVAIDLASMVASYGLADGAWKVNKHTPKAERFQRYKWMLVANTYRQDKMLRKNGLDPDRLRMDFKRICGKGRVDKVPDGLIFPVDGYVTDYKPVVYHDFYLGHLIEYTTEQYVLNDDGSVFTEERETTYNKFVSRITGPELRRVGSEYESKPFDLVDAMEKHYDTLMEFVSHGDEYLRAVVNAPFTE